MSERGDIHVPAHGREEVVIEYRPGDHVREIVVGQGAQLRLVEIVNLPQDASVAVRSHIEQAADSHVHTVLLCLGSGNVKLESTTNLAGSGAQSDLYVLNLTGDSQHTDIDVRVDHSVPDCRSFQLVKTVAGGDSHASFTGLVYVAPNAQRTVALQQSRNILLDERARIIAEPRLEIYADDVKCSHGATVGQMDDQALFYMRQRGLSDADARRLQIQGFASHIIGYITDPDTREIAERLALEKIAKL